MTSRINLRTTRFFFACGLALAAAATQAASGVSVTDSQVAAVKVGMSTTEVEQILGRPAHIISYRNAPGPTWTYHVFGANPFGMTDFDVSFGADSKVLWASERVLGGAGR